MKRYASLFLTVLSVACFCGAAAILTNRYLLQQHVQRTACQGGTLHTVVISNDQVVPAHVDAKLCDTLTIINNDSHIRIMAFGAHEDHQSYDGVEEQVLSGSQSMTVTLNKAGTYLFHDHSDDAVHGTFTVVR